MKYKYYEDMYRFAEKRNCSFNFWKNDTGEITSSYVISPKSELMLSVSEDSDGKTFIRMNGNYYDSFEEALRDYDEMLLLRGE